MIFFLYTENVQILELGIVVHSVIIGMSLGASESAKTIKPLVAALSFHQFFEGVGLGGCISQVLKQNSLEKEKGNEMTLVLLFNHIYDDHVSF